MGRLKTFLKFSASVALAVVAVFFVVRMWAPDNIKKYFVVS